MAWFDSKWCSEELDLRVREKRFLVVAVEHVVPSPGVQFKRGFYTPQQWIQKTGLPLGSAAFASVKLDEAHPFVSPGYAAQSRSDHEWSSPWTEATVRAAETRGHTWPESSVGKSEARQVWFHIHEPFGFGSYDAELRHTRKRRSRLLFANWRD